MEKYRLWLLLFSSRLRRFWRKLRYSEKIAMFKLRLERAYYQFKYDFSIRLKVLFAYLTNNVSGKRKDADGRSYRYVYRKFGFSAMLKEYLFFNTWCVK